MMSNLPARSILKLTLLLLTWGASPLEAADEGSNETDDLLNSPLFLFKAELAEEGRPYLHVTPESVILYFKSLALKTLTVSSLDYCHEHPLQKSEILNWNPRPGGPVVVIEEGDIDESLLARMGERLALNEVPATFSIVLEDGAILVVTPDDSLRRKFQSFRSLEEEENSPVLFIQMPEEDARQLFWHLQEGMGVIY